MIPSLQGLSLDCDRNILTERSWGVAAIVCDTKENTVRQGSCDRCLAVWGGGISRVCTKGAMQQHATLRRVLRRFSSNKCFLEGFLEGACEGLQ